MGRSKYLEPLTKNEKRRAQNGHTESKQKWHQTYKLTSGYRAPRTRTVIDTRVQSKTSNNSTWLHALGFVVLAAIVNMILKSDGADLKAMVKLFDEGKLKVCVDEHFAFDEVKEALSKSLTARSGGKLVIDVASPAPSESCCVVA